jgi:hypothetical protein
MTPYRDYVGKTIDRLLVEAYLPRSRVAQKESRFLCLCCCGVRKEVNVSALLRPGGTRSCGCLAREAVALRNRTHGLSHTPEWRAWRNMRQRCYNVKHADWHRYGGRGITVCQEWLQSFEQFLADMGPRPSAAYSLDRIKNDQGYSRANCIWVTKKQQSRNTSSNRLLTFLGRTQTVSAWAEELQIKVNTLYSRLSYYGMSVEEALTRPVRRKRSM